MSMVITEKYGTSRSGMLSFYENRALRLLPVYYIVLFACQLAGQFDLFGQNNSTSSAKAWGWQSINC